MSLYEQIRYQQQMQQQQQQQQQGQFGGYQQFQQQQQPPPPINSQQQQQPFSAQAPPQMQMMQQPPPQQPMMMMQPPPMMMGGGSGGGGGGGGGAADGTQGDFFRGFYEGTIRHGGVQVGSAMSWIGPIIVNLAFFLGPIWYMRRRYAQQMAAVSGGSAADAAKKGGAGSMMDMFNPMKPKKYRVEIKGTSFKDVIGIPEAKEELKQYVEFLANPGKFTRLGARLPKGCLLTGNPGTGKTLLARAIAGEAATPFLTCSGADFIEIFGGSGPKRVRELFAEAKECAPCVVFIDEIDAIGTRGGGRHMGGGSSEENRTINQLLAELDGLSSKEAVVVVAATNFSDNIDKALLREGRFDRKVNIPMPDKEARVELFNFYLKSIMTGDPICKPKIIKLKKRQTDGDATTDGNKSSTTTSTTTSADNNTNTSSPAQPQAESSESTAITVVEGVDNNAMALSLADRTPGVSPAQIATIVNEAALAAAASEEKIVSLHYLQNGIDDVLIGKKHRQRMSERSLKRTAYHECGHAMVAWFNPMQKDVIKVSVIPRGRAGGYTQQVQDEAMDPRTDQFLFSQLTVLLGGRAAERVIMGDISTGAIDDLQRATKIAMDKLLAYGMSKEIGNMAFKNGTDSQGRAWMNFSEDLHSRVENEARELVRKAYVQAENILETNKDKLHLLAQTLLEKKELMKPEVEGILGARATKA